LACERSKNGDCLSAAIEDELEPTDELDEAEALDESLSNASASEGKVGGRSASEVAQDPHAERHGETRHAPSSPSSNPSRLTVSPLRTLIHRRPPEQTALTFISRGRALALVWFERCCCCCCCCCWAPTKAALLLCSSKAGDAAAAAEGVARPERTASGRLKVWLMPIKGAGADVSVAKIARRCEAFVAGS
jgi:hypothetical protein